MKTRDFNLSYIDLLLNCLAFFAALFILALAMMNDPTKGSHQVDEKAKILVTATWDNHSPNDIDLWLKTPEPWIIGYPDPNGNIAHLERDDQGSVNNYYVKPDGTKVYEFQRREVISIRQKMDGHYVVNVYFYARHPDPVDGHEWSQPETVTVTLIEIDPRYQEIVQKQVVLVQPRDEATAISFDIRDGEIVNVGQDQDLFIEQARNQMQHTGVG